MFDPSHLLLVLFFFHLDVNRAMAFDFTFGSRLLCVGLLCVDRSKFRLDLSADFGGGPLSSSALSRQFSSVSFSVKLNEDEEEKTKAKTTPTSPQVCRP